MARDKTVYLICGMHRSGTSLIARSLISAGLPTTEFLVGPAKGNDSGHFEDEDVVYFHSNIIRRNGGSNFRISKKLTYHSSDERALRRLLRDRFESIDSPHLVLKDPRASLFLKLWAETGYVIKPLFLFRRPESVVDSLLRRGTDRAVRLFPPLAANAWRRYNEEALSASDAKLDNLHMCWVNIEDLLGGNVERPARAIQSHFELAAGFSLVGFEQNKFQLSKPSMRAKFACVGVPGLQTTYKRLVTLAEQSAR